MIFGLNSDDIVNQVDDLIDFLTELHLRPTVGIVCDPGMPPVYYLRACKRLAPHADILLRPFDSSSLMIRRPRLDLPTATLDAQPSIPRYSVMQYVERAQEYAKVLGKYCGKTGGLECGNEITLPAAFVGPNIAAQVRGAIEVSKAFALRTFVCYFWDNDDPQAMGRSARAWGLRPDCAGVSIYPLTYGASLASPAAPIAALVVAHPAIPVGILEFGTQNSEGDDSVADGVHLALVEQYVNFIPPEPHVKYFGGNFEWDAATYLIDSERGPSEKALYWRLAQRNIPWGTI